jgi:hypothetical protein
VGWSHLIVGLAALFVSGLVLSKLRHSSVRRSFRLHIDYDSHDERELGKEKDEGSE